MSEKYQLYAQQAVERLQNKDKNQLSVAVGVPMNIFISLHKQFDQGKKIVYTGKSDGNNRRIKRLENFALVDFFDRDRELVPYEMIMNAGPVPISPVGAAVKNLVETNGKADFNWIYGNERNEEGGRVPVGISGKKT